MPLNLYANILKTFPPKIQAVVKIKIAQIITEKEIKQVEEESLM